MIKILKLVWDSWNTVHIARHDVIPDEVEEVAHNDPLVQQGKKGRLLIIGFTKKQRPLTVILDPEELEGVYYPVTAHTASRSERKIFRTEKEVEENDTKETN